ncbi:MAG: sigma-70 family RNA polymerase sigma factor [Planctomycetes bacterium]|nr:sigma-70 family RNA polymerase sigma factor [Planctomycetota bacterium]
MNDDANGERDDSIVQRARSGERVAIEALLVRNLPRLEAMVRLDAGPAVAQRESITDVVQSVCAEVVKGLATFEFQSEAAFRCWLAMHVRHKVIDKARYYKAQCRDRAREAEASTPSVFDVYRTLCTPSRVMSGREALEHFEAAFADLHPDQREAITLYRIVGLSYSEISERMGKSEGAVRNLVYRGLARLAISVDDR